MRKRLARLLSTAALVLLAHGMAPDRQLAEETLPSGKVEQVERHLIQVTLTIDGPAERVAQLGPKDFQVIVGSREIQSFDVDVTCAAGSATSPPPEGTVEPSVPERHFPASVLLYFDQAHLTATGRIRAYAAAAQLATSLIGAGHQVKIVADGRRLTRVTGWTTDAGGVAASLEKVKADASQNLMDDATDRQNLEMLRQAFDEMDQKEEMYGVSVCFPFEMLWRRLEERHREALELDRRSLDRLASMLWEMEGIPAPKAVVLYADTLRSSPGQAYTDELYRDRALKRMIERAPWCRRYQTVAFGVSGYLQEDTRGNIEALVKQAAARGVRIHTVEPQGLTAEDTRRAQETLAGIALDTGGRSFLGAGSAADRVATALVADAECPVILSFDADQVPSSKAQSLNIRLRAKGLKLHAPSRVVAETPSQHRRARWLAAALTASDSPQDPPVFAGLVPIGREERAFLALVQVVAPPSPSRTSRWELSAALLDRDVVDQESSATVSTNSSSVPCVLEVPIRVGRSGVEVVVVGHDTATDETAAMRRQDAWPDLDKEPAGLAPIALVQPARGAFVRGGQTRSRGTLTIPPDTGPDRGKEVAFIGVACRGRKETRRLTLERTLTGQATYPFEPVELDVSAADCGQFRDTVPAGTLGPGVYVYAARILAEGETLSTRSLPFKVGTETQGPAIAP